MPATWLFGVAVATALCLMAGQAHGSCEVYNSGLSSLGKPLLKPSRGSSFKRILSLDGGALRSLVAAMALIEVEASIKHHLLANPKCLPSDLGITDVDDFDIHLVDYFDCVTGTSAGSWISVYLTSRGGHGAARAVLDDPAIVEKYGSIAAGSAEGLRVFFNEYGSTIYPIETIDSNAGTWFDVTNPNAPGSTKTVYTLEGLERSLEAFVGDATLADVDTSLLIPTVDLGTGQVVYFVHNAFKDPPVTSTATLVPPTGPQPLPMAGMSIMPKLSFEEGKNYYLKDIGAASGAPIALKPAKAMKQVGNDTVEYYLIDNFAMESTDLFAALFVSSEAQTFDIEKLAILSVGAGFPSNNFTSLRNAGNTQWSRSIADASLLLLGSVRMYPALMDYLFYANPVTKPLQYLRINGLRSTTPDVEISASNSDPRGLPQFEKFGQAVASEYRHLIDIFVKDFIFS